MGSGFHLSTTDLFIDSRRETMIMKRLKHREEQNLGIQNPEMRCLSIAAFLRCLFNSIESAPGIDGRYYDAAIENIKSDKIFGQITQLCASTGWLHRSIGIKYLQVMRYVVRVDTTTRLEDVDNIGKYEILSIVI